MSEVNPFETNIFRIIGKETSETVHSAFLAYLLNPKGITGKDFLLKILEICSKKQELPSDVIENIDFIMGRIKNTDCSDIHVLTEDYLDEKNIEGRKDIVLFNDDFYICIENKIKAHDSKDQLVKYFNDTVAENSKHKEKKYLHLFLTPFGDKPENESGDVSKWVLFSYEEIKSCLENMRRNELMDQYVSIIEKNVLTDERRNEHFSKLYTALTEALTLDIAENREIFDPKERKYSFTNGEKKFWIEFASDTKDRIIYGFGNWKSINPEIEEKIKMLKNPDDFYDVKNDIGNAKGNNYIYKLFDKNVKNQMEYRYNWIKKNEDQLIKDLSARMNIFSAN